MIPNLGTSDIVCAYYRGLKLYRYNSVIPFALNLRDYAELVFGCTHDGTIRSDLAHE